MFSEIIMFRFHVNFLGRRGYQTRKLHICVQTYVKKVTRRHHHCNMSIWGSMVCTCLVWVQLGILLEWDSENPSLCLLWFQRFRPRRREGQNKTSLVKSAWIFPRLETRWIQTCKKKRLVNSYLDGGQLKHFWNVHPELWDLHDPIWR